MSPFAKHNSFKHPPMRLDTPLDSIVAIRQLKHNEHRYCQSTQLGLCAQLLNVLILQNYVFLKELGLV
jgi:hypothetical protein